MAVRSGDVVDRVVDQWRQVLPEIATTRLAVAKRLGLVAAHITAASTASLDRLGLDLGEFDVLATLLRQGEPHQLAPTALARDAMVSTSGMTKRLDRLERRGLIQRQPDPDDRRALLIMLSPKGAKLARAAVTLQADTIGSAFASLGDAQLAKLADLLRSPLAAFHTDSNR